MIAIVTRVGAEAVVGDVVVGDVVSDAFTRQRVLPGFGAQGQDRLGSARVAIVGLGGLGCPAALYLAAAGVGHLTLVDSDQVAVSNLHRQVLYGPADCGEPKVEAAARALARVAPAVTVVTQRTRLGADAAAVLAGHDVVLDCTDTWPSRYAVAAACEELGVPLVWGAVSGWFGQVTVFDGKVTLDDLFPSEPPADFGVCDGGGVLGTLCGQVGTAMASQAVVMMAGFAGLVGTLAIIDARDGVWRHVAVGGGHA